MESPHRVRGLEQWQIFLGSQVRGGSPLNAVPKSFPMVPLGLYFSLPLSYSPQMLYLSKGPWQ